MELKNDVALMGTLHSVDQYLNVKLLNVSIVEPEKYPQLVSISLYIPSLHWLTLYGCIKVNMKNCFIRGSVVRYIQIPSNEVDTELLQDAARREANANKQT